MKSSADTLYFGGGTPSLLGGERIARLVSAARSAFSLQEAEITVEANPADRLVYDFELMAKAGVNRISLGVQSSDNGELKALSRRHNCSDVKRTVCDAKAVGIENISLDLMLGIPHQTEDSLKRSLDFLLEQEPTHISCYMLKIEPNTPFGRLGAEKLDLPGDDSVADMYLFTSDYLRSNGFVHYEISNFAKPGFESRHNTKYWECNEYLGLGPSAHSYIGGKRFHFERSTEMYLASPFVIDDGTGGDLEEYCMLGLRLKKGLDLEDIAKRFGVTAALSVAKKAERFKKTDLVKLSDSAVALTPKGFLVSNSLISEIIF